MSSIYRSSPSKRSKAGVGSPASGGAGGGGSGSWTLLGPEPLHGNPDWPCPRKGCKGFLVARTRKNSNSQYGICETRKGDDPLTCQAYYNINKRHWGTGENPRVCDWCDADTGDSPSIGVPSDGDTAKPWANDHTVWKQCLGSRSLEKLKFAWVVPEDSPLIGVPCEAVAENREVGTDIKTKCTGKVKQGDLLLKKTGDYLLEDRPALHFHCAKRAFDIELHKIVAKKQECKVLGTSIEEESKQACAPIPTNLGDEF